MMTFPKYAVLCPVRWQGEIRHVMGMKNSDQNETVVTFWPSAEFGWETPPHQLDWAVEESRFVEVNHEEYRWRLDQLLDFDRAFPDLKPAVDEA